MDEVILEEGEMTKETAAALAEEIGFKGRGIFETKDLNFLKEVRDMCKANKCGNYGRLWTCPPACGTLADSRKKAKQFKWGIVLQTTAQMEDEFDGEAIEEAQVTQRDRFLQYVGRLREMGEEAFLRTAVCELHLSGCALPLSRQGIYFDGGLRTAGHGRMQKRGYSLLLRQKYRYFYRLCIVQIR